MGWFIFSLWIISIGILCAILYTFDSWFDEHKSVENVLMFLGVVLVSPVILLGVFWHWLFKLIKG